MLLYCLWWQLLWRYQSMSTEKQTALLESTWEFDHRSWREKRSNIMVHLHLNILKQKDTSNPWKTWRNLPNCCHGDKRPPESLEWSREERFGKVDVIPIHVLHKIRTVRANTLAIWTFPQVSGYFSKVLLSNDNNCFTFYRELRQK